MDDSQAVSLIPAAYYADLCCERGRYYLNEFFGDPSWAGSVERHFHVYSSDDIAEFCFRDLKNARDVHGAACDA